MVKTIIAVVMLTVSTLAYADKWEYADFTVTDRTIIAKRTSRIYIMTFTYGKERDEKGHTLIASGTTDYIAKSKEIAKEKFFKKMGWPAQEAKNTDTVMIFDKFGLDGWELVSTISATHEAGSLKDRLLKYWFKRRID